MAEFKKAPQYQEESYTFGGIYPFDEGSLEALLMLYWPALLGLALAFFLVVIGKQEKSFYAVCMAALAQGAMLIAAQTQ